MNEPTKLRVVFMGTPAFGLPCLEALHSRHQLIAVYSQPPQAADRGLQLRQSPVQRWAESKGVPVFTPKSLRKAAAQTEFASLQPDVAVVAAYGLILPQAVLDIPRYGCINLHGSLLPRWRGAAPIQRAIAAGDSESGVSIMQMAAGLDTGPVWRHGTVPITAGTTASTLHDTLATLGAALILPALDDVMAGTLQPTPQPEEGVTYADKITKAEGALDFATNAAVLERKIRAFTPWPGAWFISQGVRIKVLQASVGPPQHQQAACGTLLRADGLISCGDGTSLQLQQVQREGKAATDAAAFFRGFSVKAGMLL